MSSDLANQNGIDVAQLERELTALWTSVGEEEPHGGVTRSCVLNLLIYSPASRTDYRLDETLIEVTEHHPSRAIVLVEDRETDQPMLDSWVNSRCTLPSANSRQVCCEQITIKASRERAREAPSAISSLVLADLPVFLWWRDELRLSDPLFRRCASLSDRLLIDTARVDSHERGFAQIAEFLQTNQRLPLMDLNWTRLQTWRSIIAGFYDVTDYRPVLNRLHEVEISYHADSDTRLTPRAVYLAAWLASRLGWVLKRESVRSDGDCRRLTFAAGAAEVDIVLRAVRGASDRLGHLNDVTLRSGGGVESPSEFRVRKTADGMRLAASVTIDGVRRSERVLGYDQWSDSSLLAVELEGVLHDRVFEQSALVANDIVCAVLAN